VNNLFKIFSLILGQTSN